MSRSAQDILAERRSVINEQRRERDQLARAILQHQINELDAELRDMSEVWTMGEWASRMVQP